VPIHLPKPELFLNRRSIVVSIICLAASATVALGQAECNGYGGLRGIRVDGQLMPFTTILRATRRSDGAVATTANERTRNPTFTHNGDTQVCTGGLAFGGAGGSFAFADRRVPPPLTFIETFKSSGRGSVDASVRITANQAFDGDVDFAVELPIAPFQESPGPASQPTTQGDGPSVVLSGAGEQLKISANQTVEWLPSHRGGGSLLIHLVAGHLDQDATRAAGFTLRASGEIDRAPLALTMDCAHPGQPFAGIGGNFRLQNPSADPAIIQYNLDHLRVAWSRIAMPLNLWQPDEAGDPAGAAEADLNPAVRAAMEMGRTLAQRKVPSIISVWSAPQWALGPASFPTRAATRRAAGMADAPNRAATRPAARPVRGRAIRPEKLTALCRSITAYLLYARSHYQFEPALFSFNESELGIDIRQTPAEHDQLIRTLGPMLAAARLKTRMLLGDTSDCTPTHFVDVAMNDPAATPYIGAISFHSWRGGTDAQLRAWGEAARRLDVPLIVAEGGTDAAAWAYPAIFREPWFSLDEIGLYVRICALDQPASILEWQLTSDYSILTGGRDAMPLAPTMRFWQLKQLGLTPAGAVAVPISGGGTTVQACAYLGDGGACAIHLVNAGAARSASITGLPDSVHTLRTLVTDADRGMADADAVTVAHGVATVPLQQMSFTTLLGTP
jgi:hypothetical protein